MAPLAQGRFSYGHSLTLWGHVIAKPGPGRLFAASISPRVERVRARMPRPSTGCYRV
jgi:hypothetical protein